MKVSGTIAAAFMILVMTSEADAQTKSLLGDDRGKAIIQDNWRFLIEYFHKERITE